MPATLRIIIILLLCAGGKLPGQSPVIAWQQTYGGSGQQAGNAICASNSGGFVFALSSTVSDSYFTGNYGAADCWIVKTDSLGNVLWKTQTGGSRTDAPRAIVALKNGGYAVAGYTSSSDYDVVGKHSDDETSDYWVIVLNEDGRIKWQRCYGGTDYDYCNSIDITPDGGFILAGLSSSKNGDVTGEHGNGDCWIVRLNAVGDIAWQRCVGGTYPDQANHIKTETDGTFVITGFSFSDNADVAANNRSGNVWMYKMSETGGMQWQRSFGGALTDYGQQVIRADDGGYVLAGYAYSPDYGNHGNADYYVIKIDKNANLLWQQCLGGSENDFAQALVETSDGGYAIAGTSHSANGNVIGNRGAGDGWLVKLNANGNIQWNKNIGGTRTENIFGIIKAADGGIVVIGSAESNDGDLTGNTGTNSDAWMVKLGCEPVLPSIKVLQNAAVLCAGQNAVFSTQINNAGSSPLFEWIKNGITVGSSATYEDATLKNGDIIFCWLSSSLNCALVNRVASDTIVVNVTNAYSPVVVIGAASTEVCKGSAVLFNIQSPLPNPNDRYNWYLNNKPVGNMASFKATDIADGDSIFLELISGESCAAVMPVRSNVIIMRVANGVAPSVSISAADTAVCAGTTMRFTAVANTAGVVYSWLVNNVTAAVNTKLFETAILKNGDEVSCAVTAAGTGCNLPVVSSPVRAVIYNLPQVVCRPDTSVPAGTKVALTADVTGDISTALWTSAQVIQQPQLLPAASVTPVETAVYRLTVFTTEGCSNYDETVITVLNKAIIPTAFSPNNDGINDTWKLPPSVLCNDCIVSVFDRWGKLVYNSKTNNSKLWNATFNGKPLPAGVYFYVISQPPQKTPLTGSVTILR